MRFGGLGGFGGWLALCSALWAAGASGQPVIVDPDPADPDLDWELRLEPVVAAGVLTSPSALAFFGRRVDEQFLVLEKDTGRVRYFAQRIDQGVVLDLAVDNCGERGLVGIALHPNFDPTPTPVPPPPALPPERLPDQDWVYLSYHTGTVPDGCGGDAVLHVERYKWTGTALVPDPLVAPFPDPPDPSEPFLPFEPFELSVAPTTAVGGTILASSHLSFDGRLVPRLFVAIGSLGRDGTLQNNETVDPAVFDDTGVILRLDQNGKTPLGNPFDDDQVVAEPQDRYYAYGIRNPRGLALDPFSLTFPVWFTELSDADKPDEISSAIPGTNGGYSDLQGRATQLLPNTDPLYPLVDLEKKPGADPDPVSTYRLPSFSFVSKEVEPTGLAFGLREVGPGHVGALFVGGKDGRLFRFLPNGSRASFFLGCADRHDESPRCLQLIDTVAAAGDDLGQILVGEGFGAISDVETGLDGSIYVLGKDSGAVHRVFSDAVRDLAVSRAKVPTRISLSAKKPFVDKPIRVTIENRGELTERILAEDLDALLGVQISGLPPANCTAPTPTVDVPWFAEDPYTGVIGIKPKDKLSLSVDVRWECPNATPSPKGVFDFETSFDLNPAVIGIIDERPENDVCPRPPIGDDKGCGGKGGGPLQTDLIQK